MGAGQPVVFPFCGGKSAVRLPEVLTFPAWTDNVESSGLVEGNTRDLLPLPDNVFSRSGHGSPPRSLHHRSEVYPYPFPISMGSGLGTTLRRRTQVDQGDGLQIRYSWVRIPSPPVPAQSLPFAASGGGPTATSTPAACSAATASGKRAIFSASSASTTNSVPCPPEVARTRTTKSCRGKRLATLARFTGAPGCPGDVSARTYCTGGTERDADIGMAGGSYSTRPHVSTTTGNRHSTTSSPRASGTTAISCEFNRAAASTRSGLLRGIKRSRVGCQRANCTRCEIKPIPSAPQKGTCSVTRACGGRAQGSLSARAVRYPLTTPCKCQGTPRFAWEFASAPNRIPLAMAKALRAAANSAARIAISRC